MFQINSQLISTPSDSSTVTAISVSITSCCFAMHMWSYDSAANSETE